MGEGACGTGGREYGDVGVDVEYLGELCAVREGLRSYGGRWSMRHTGSKVDMVSCDREGRHDLLAEWESWEKGLYLREHQNEGEP